MHPMIAGLTFYDLWHPLSGNGYQFWSGVGSDLSEITLLGIAYGAWRHVNCATPRCWRFGKHPTADGLHKLCARHHPDLPNRRLSLREIQERHEAAKPKPRARVRPVAKVARKRVTPPKT